MPRRSNSSQRVVIMDDISWSEPVPRSRRLAAELDPPEWMQTPSGAFTPDADPEHPGAEQVEDVPVTEPPRRRGGDRLDGARRPVRPASGFRVSDYLGELEADLDPVDLLAAEEPPLFDDDDERDEEEIWGPRPRLHASEPGGRRTVVITGRVADRHVAPRAGARDSLPGHARYGFQADRTAMWAVLLCVIVLLVAVTSH